MPLSYPQINGVRYDFSSVDININGPLIALGVVSLNYKDSLKPGELRGNKAALIGRTRGKYEASADMEVYKSEWNEIIKSLGPGFMEASFPIVASHSEPSLGPDAIIVDTLVGARITDQEDQKQEGEEPLKVKVTLSLMKILWNGIDPLNPLKSL